MCLATARDKEGRGAAATEFPQRDAGRVPAEVRACHPTGMKRNSLFTAGNMEPRCVPTGRRKLPVPNEDTETGASQGMPLHSQPQFPSVRRGDTCTSRGTHICSRIFLKSSNSCRAVLRPSAMRLQLSPPPPMNLQEAGLWAPRHHLPPRRAHSPQGATSRPQDHT